ncbi:MAG: endonuclease/exonuclease/phosphatase family protein [Bacteroidales bacterium]|nr:endonuclease/exonuclease/phosphatase family protein [Bacteroidales bacterium]
MKRAVGIILGLFIALEAFAGDSDSLLVMFWNVENFFDADPSNGGEDFSPSSERHWTKSRFRTKSNGISKTILWVGSAGGRLPDVVGLAELENDKAVRSIVFNEALKRAGYGYIHFDSPDPRGIDVGLLYRKAVLKPLEAFPVTIKDDNGNPLGTRDILVARMEDIGSGDVYNFIVNHHPSKFSGASVSDVKRRTVMAHLLRICKDLEGPVIAMGDFNDTPDDPNFSVLDSIMTNKATSLFEKGKGTIKYDGKWDLIDMFFVSREVDSVTEMRIEYPPFLLVHDSAHGGSKPFRTFSGPRYNGGLSDHLPITLKIRKDGH